MRNLESKNLHRNPTKSWMYELTGLGYFPAQDGLYLPDNAALLWGVRNGFYSQQSSSNEALMPLTGLQTVGLTGNHLLHGVYEGKSFLTAPCVPVACCSVAMGRCRSTLEGKFAASWNRVLGFQTGAFKNPWMWQTWSFVRIYYRQATCRRCLFSRVSFDFHCRAAN